MGNKCCKTIHGDFQVTYPCKNAAKVERNGKWYCGTHDPDKRKARQEKQQAKWEKESEDRQKQWRLQSAAPDLLAACKLTHSTMRRQFVGGNAPDSWGDDEHAAFTQLNAAIAKAEGKQ